MRPAPPAMLAHAALCFRRWLTRLVTQLVAHLQKVSFLVHLLEMNEQSAEIGAPNDLFHYYFCHF